MIIRVSHSCTTSSCPLHYKVRLISWLLWYHGAVSKVETWMPLHFTTCHGNMISKSLHRQVIWLTNSTKKRRLQKMNLGFALVPRLKGKNLTTAKSADTLKLPWRSWSFVQIELSFCFFPRKCVLLPLISFVYLLSWFVHLCSINGLSTSDGLCKVPHLWSRSRWSDIPPSLCSDHTPMKGLLRGRRGSANASSSSGKILILKMWGAKSCCPKSWVRHEDCSYVHMLLKLSKKLFFVQ